MIKGNCGKENSARNSKRLKEAEYDLADVTWFL